MIDSNIRVDLIPHLNHLLKFSIYINFRRKQGIIYKFGVIMITKEQALAYHAEPVAGKLTVKASKKCETQEELSMAYTPGVAEPCLEIEKNPQDVFKYTNKGNLVAVISNGTAVLGLGDIGAAAGKPVMEGKGVLFKRFADVDVFDIELNTKDPDEIIKI